MSYNQDSIDPRTTRKSRRERCLVWGVAHVLVGLAGCGDGAEIVQPPAGPRAQLDQTVEPLLGAADGRLSDVGLSCQLWPAASSPFAVTMSLENSGTQAVEFSTRETAWDGGAKVMRVQLEGRELPYVGVIARRPPVSPSEHVRLAPGESISIDYDLTENHSAEQRGTYEIALSSPLIQVRLDGVPLALQHDCGALTAAFQASQDGAIGRTRQALTVPETDAPCTAAQLQLVRMTDAVAQVAVAAARRQVIHTSSYYWRWFGDPDFGRDEAVDVTFQEMVAREAQLSAACDWTDGECGRPGQEGWLAWSVANGNVVHLCDGFFSYNSFRIEDPGGLVPALVHEKAHNVGWIDDIAPNAMAARDLAVNDPDSAVVSAINYDRFAPDVYLGNSVIPSFAPLLL